VESKYNERAEKMGKMAALADVLTDYTYLNPTPVTAAYLSNAGGRVWLYRWDHDKNSFPMAHHFSEMAYIFDFSVEEYHKGYPITDENHSVAKMMNEIWTSFILNGDPNINGLPDWIPYHKTSKGVRMYLKANPEVKPFDLDHDCDREMPIQVIRY
jgi:carboxylesterase type B